VGARHRPGTTAVLYLVLLAMGNSQTATQMGTGMDTTTEEGDDRCLALRRLVLRALLLMVLKGRGGRRERRMGPADLRHLVRRLSTELQLGMEVKDHHLKVKGVKVKGIQVKVKGSKVKVKGIKVKGIKDGDKDKIANRSKGTGVEAREQMVRLAL